MTWRSDGMSRALTARAWRDGVPRRLKVYRTPIGFHDAYVAAPSQQAALTAWGSEANLFARGVAEEVTDPELTAEPLAHPGEIIRRVRGTAAEQLAAAARSSPGQRQPNPRGTPTPRAATAAPRRPAPLPPRDRLDEAEAALAACEADYERQRRDLDAQAAEIAQARRALVRQFERDQDRLVAARDRERAAYQEKLAAIRSP